MLIYTVRFISFPDDCGNTLKHRTEIRGVYWKQCDTCLCKNSTAKSKMKENRPTSCLHSVSLFLTCSTVSFQRSVSLDFCEIYLAKIVQEVGKKGRMKIRVCPEHNSLSPHHKPHSNMRYQWQKVMQIIAIILSAVPQELGSSQSKSDKLELVKILFKENSNISKSGCRAVNSTVSHRK